MIVNALFRRIVLPGVLVGLVLHAYTCFYVAEGGASRFTVGLFALSILPYLTCLYAGTKSGPWPVVAACITPLLLLVDGFAFKDAVISPTASTSSLVLLVAPILNLVVLLLGFVVGGLARRAAERRKRISKWK